TTLAWYGGSPRVHGPSVGRTSERDGAAIALPLPERVEPAVILLALPVQEAHLVGHDLSRLAPLALVLVGADLQPALDGHQRPLARVLSHDLSQTAPGDDVDEVGLLLAVLGVGPVHGQGEPRPRDPFSAVAQFGVAG